MPKVKVFRDGMIDSEKREGMDGRDTHEERMKRIRQEKDTK